MWHKRAVADSQRSAGNRQTDEAQTPYGRTHTQRRRPTRINRSLGRYVMSVVVDAGTRAAARTALASRPPPVSDSKQAFVVVVVMDRFCARGEGYGGLGGRQETDQKRHTKLLGKTWRPCCLRCSSRSSPDHQPSSGVAVTAMMSPAWKSNSSSMVAW